MEGYFTTNWSCDLGKSKTFQPLAQAQCLLLPLQGTVILIYTDRKSRIIIAVSEVDVVYELLFFVFFISVESSLVLRHRFILRDATCQFSKNSS